MSVDTTEDMMGTKLQAAFPGTVRDVEGPGLQGLRNAVYGLTVLAEGKPVNYTVTLAGDDDAPGENLASTTDLAEAQSAYARGWLRSAATGIGLGFHPDTPAAGYEPPLGDALAAQYDTMIGFCHDHLEDPYEVSMSAWRDAGLVSDGPSA